MKAVFIAYGQSLANPVENLLDKLKVRGFTRWNEVSGRGSYNGEPHYGTHAWPSKNGALITFVDDNQAEALCDGLRRINEQAEEQGVRAFTWEAGAALM